jgi:hypothetical protein
MNSVNFLIIPVLNIQGYVRQSENEESTSLPQILDVVTTASG